MRPDGTVKVDDKYVEVPYEDDNRPEVKIEYMGSYTVLSGLDGELKSNSVVGRAHRQNRYKS